MKKCCSLFGKIGVTSPRFVAQFRQPSPEERGSRKSLAELNSFLTMRPAFQTAQDFHTTFPTTRPKFTERSGVNFRLGVLGDVFWNHVLVPVRVFGGCHLFPLCFLYPYKIPAKKNEP